MAEEQDTRRFRIPPEASAQVFSYGMATAKQLRSFELYTEGYIERLRQLAGRTTGKTSESSPTEGLQQTYEQMGALRRVLVDLAMDAQQAGNDNLKKRRPFVEPDVKLMDMPDGSDPAAVMATMMVIRDRFELEGRNCADQLERLAGALDKVPDPTVLLLADQLRKAAGQLRPPPREGPGRSNL